MTDLRRYYSWVKYDSTTKVILEFSESEPTTVAGESKFEISGSHSNIQPAYFFKFDDTPSSEAVIENDEDSITANSVEYIIQEISDPLTVLHKEFQNINYKIELKNGESLTPVFIIHFDGANAGLLDKTQYYKDYVDDNNKGTLVLEVHEVYTIDESEPTLPHSAKPALDRVKTWKHVKKSDGLVDEENVKTKPKQYNTRAKRHKEGNRRRGNIMEQLIDHTGLAGVLSGAFSSEEDAFDKLTAMQTLHSAAFTSWENSGRGPIYDDITNDSTTSWLDTVVPDNGTTQAMCPWMIGLSFRTYLVGKLKGELK